MRPVGSLLILGFCSTLLILSHSTFAFSFFPRHSNFADLYSASMERNFGLKMARVRELTKYIYLANPSFLWKWKLINNEAAATYNSSLNTIEVSEDLTTKDVAGNLRLLSFEELVQKSENSYDLAVVFHELAHGHLDEIIPDRANPADRRLMNVINNEMIPWFHARFPHENSEIAMSELFAYYAEGVIANLLSERSSILYTNGLDIAASKCFMTVQLRKDVYQLSREEFQKLQAPKVDVSYKNQVRLSSIWVNAKNLDFTTPGNHLPEKFWNELWEHFIAIFSPPKTRFEFADFLQKSQFQKQLLEKCRGDYWDQIHGIRK